MSRLIGILCILICGLPLLQGQQLHFIHHTFSEALGAINPRKIVETQDGFIWIGTEEGLFRYDGTDFEKYERPDSLENSVTALFESSEGRLWVGYKDGQIAYTQYFEQLKLWEIEEGMPSVPITDFSIDKKGYLWIATYGEGVYYHNKKHLYNINTDDDLLGNDIYCLVMDSIGRMWTGTDQGISICQLINNEKRVINLQKQDGLPDDIIRAILPDEEGFCWVGGYDNGFCRIKIKDFEISYPPREWTHGAISAFSYFPGVELWIGTENEGAFRYDLNKKSILPLSHKDQNIHIDRIYDLYNDKEGNIWMINNSLGVCSANRQFELLELDIASVQAIREATDTTLLWLGTMNGLYSYDLFTQNLTPYFTDKALNIIALYEDVYRNIWLGTFGEGLYCFRPSDGELIHLTEANGLSNNSILSIDGQNGIIWLATLGGVTEIRLDDDIMSGSEPDIKNYNHETELGTNFIYKVFVDSRGSTWFGTDGQGLCVLENGTIRSYTNYDDYDFRSVYSITEDWQGNIWFSTAREGIFVFNRKSFRPLTVKEGIRDLQIAAMATDNKNNILLVHSSGLDILDPSIQHLIYYDQEVGLKDITPNLNAIGHGSHGSIWIGTQHKIVRYTALKNDLSIHPRTLITEVSAQLKPIPLMGSIELPYQQNSLIFEYVGLWYTDPATVKYRYKLEGFDNDWIYSRDRTATYSSLPPGDYTFFVTSTENEAFGYEPIISYPFTIQAPFWQRWWFIMLASIAIVLGGIYAIRIREKRIEREAFLQKEKAISQLETLKSQVNPHFLFNSFNTLVALIEEDSALAVEYVEHLSDFYRSILQYREKNLISLEEEFKVVTSYFYLLQKRYGENINMIVEPTEYSGKIAPLTLQMLVENAVKHNIISASKPLQIKIAIQDGYLIVQNNLQPKLTKERSTGFGLQSITNHYAMITNKKVSVHYTDSLFEVRIPLLEGQKTLAK